jgi:hypothetical protein
MRTISKPSATRTTAYGGEQDGFHIIIDRGRLHFALDRQQHRRRQSIELLWSVQPQL